MTTTVTRPETGTTGSGTMATGSGTMVTGTPPAPEPTPARQPEDGTAYRVLKEILAVRAVATEGGFVIEGDPLPVLLPLGVQTARSPKGAMEKAIAEESPEDRGGTYVATPDRNWSTDTPSGFRSVVDW